MVIQEKYDTRGVSDIMGFKCIDCDCPEDREEEYLMIGLANEVGELLGKYKKQIRGDGDKYKEIRAELGDVLWYLARMFDHYELMLNEILHENFLKLTDRKNRGVIKGDGDSR